MHISTNVLILKDWREDGHLVGDLNEHGNDFVFYSAVERKMPWSTVFGSNRHFGGLAPFGCV